MTFYMLDELTKMAKDKGKTLCAWHPYPVVAGTNGGWIFDSSGSVRRYQADGLGIDLVHHSHRILVRKDGTIEGL